MNMQPIEKTAIDALEHAGTASAVSPARKVKGLSVMLRLSTLVVVMVFPGALLVLAAWVLAHAVAERMRAEQGTQGRRLARAVATVRLREVWSQARRLV
jgi:hypothetical protein